MPKCVIILFSDGTWFYCREDEIDKWTKSHQWKSDCYKTARVLYADFDKLYLINLEE